MQIEMEWVNREWWVEWCSSTRLGLVERHPKAALQCNHRNSVPVETGTGSDWASDSYARTTGDACSHKRVGVNRHSCLPDGGI